MHAAAVKNPWALSHGITGLGATFLAADGRKASDVVVGDFLLRNVLPDGGVGVGSPYGFATYAPDGTPIEPHPNLHVKTFVMAGLAPSTRFTTPWKQSVTLQQLIDGVKRGYRHVPSNAEYWHDVAWTLDALSQTTKPGGTVATDAGPVSIDTVMNDALAELEAETADLKAGLAKGLPQVDKRKQGVYAHSCGGLHFVQAVLGWARFPQVRKAWGPRVEAQIDILFYRLGSEARQYEAALQQLPQYKLQLLTQQLKFYGHFLETTARLKTDLGWKPTELQLISVNTAKAYLDATVRELQAMKAFENMASIEKTQRQVYLDLIGDACHATHGLDGWR
ncbi:MAG: hypothetical protein JNG84_10375 [Archangium sp.]|nr:hypothetical protein [Archangium sp.]